MKYPLAKPYIRKQEERAVLRVLRSGKLSLGPEVPEFEQKISGYIGTKYACAVNSGTAGLHLALLSLGIQKGDEVITTPLSFVASANAILYVGAKPVFVDIDEKTFNVDTSKIEKKITRRTKAILVVHIFGQSADMDPILKLAKKYKLKIIEDACESIGATYKGKKVGTFGDVAVFSFYPNKQITTGEGGMIVTNSKKIHELCTSLRNQGRAKDMRWLDHKRLGYNYRMDEMSAAVGLSQFQKLNFFIKERRKIAGWYAKYLNSYREIIQVPSTAKYNKHTWFVYVVQIKKKRVNRDTIIKKLANPPAGGGIETKPYFPPIHLFSFYRKQFRFKVGDFPICEAVGKRVLALPFYVGLTRRDVQHICQKLIDVVLS